MLGAKYIALRTLYATPSAIEEGSIVKSDPEGVVISLGVRNGISKGQELLVRREGDELRDPDSGEVLGRAKRLLGRLIVADVREKYSIAKPEGKLVAELKRGDSIVPEPQKFTIAVMRHEVVSIGTAAHRTLGLTVADDIVEALVSERIPVVERQLLEKVLAGLRREQAEEFSPELVRKFGKQIGATYVIGGTIRCEYRGRNRYRYVIHTRLIKVETSEVVAAIKWTKDI